MRSIGTTRTTLPSAPLAPDRTASDSAVAKSLAAPEVTGSSA